MATLTWLCKSIFIQVGPVNYLMAAIYWRLIFYTVNLFRWRFKSRYILNGRLPWICELPETNLSRQSRKSSLFGQRRVVAFVLFFLLPAKPAPFPWRRTRLTNSQRVCHPPPYDCTCGVRVLRRRVGHSWFMGGTLSVFVSRYDNIVNSENFVGLVIFQI
jgi:hypothetical protein